MATLNGNLELLLADATDFAPTLAEGLSEQALSAISLPDDELMSHETIHQRQR